MALKVWDGSAWQTSTAIKVWNGTAWTSATSGKVWNGSAWVNFFGGLPILPQYNNITYDIELERVYSDISWTAPTLVDAYVQIILSNDGTGAYRYGDYATATSNFTTFTWLPPGDSVSNYTAFMDTPTTGAFTGGSAVNSALPLSTTRFWQLLISENATPGSHSDFLTSTLRIKNLSGTDLVARTLSFSVGLELGSP